jgi:adenine-specific DNA-methyltransferase
MLETLRKVATLQIHGDMIKFRGIKPPAKSLNLDAEAEQIDPDLDDLLEEAAVQKALKMKPGKRVAFVFGPENGAVNERLVHEAAKEADARNFEHLYVIGFACQDSAMKYIQSENVSNVPISYVSASMDLQMGDLLKNQRSSQVFAVTGMPDIWLTRLKKKGDTGETLYQAELRGLDTFDPVTMDTKHMNGDDVPAWFLDCDYNDLAFCVNQAFFPRTGAWDNLKKNLKGVYNDEVWERLAGAVSAPFAAGGKEKIAVKVIDDRGNELMVIKRLRDAAVEE